MPDGWNDLSTNDKLFALRQNALERAAQCNDLAKRLDQLHQAVVEQVLPMVEQIAALEARVKALE